MVTTYTGDFYHSKYHLETQTTDAFSKYYQVHDKSTHLFINPSKKTSTFYSLFYFPWKITISDHWISLHRLQTMEKNTNRILKYSNAFLALTTVPQQLHVIFREQNKLKRKKE